MRNRHFASFVLGCLLALLPSPLSAVPWDPNRPRPSGFQRTLAYLENDLYDYPQSDLQSVRNHILHDDLVTTLIPQLKQWGEPPERWPELAQRQIADMRTAQYEGLKTVIRQTMPFPEAIIQAIENNQPLPEELLEQPDVKAFIMVKWQLLNIAEQTYQALLYVKGGTPGNSPPTDIPRTQPKGGKNNNQLDYERMRRDRQAAIERRKALEARENARRWTELNELIRRILSNEAESTNKFKQARTGNAVPIPVMQVAVPAEKDDASPPDEPAVTTDAASTDPAPPPDGTPDKPAKAGQNKIVKIKIYQGTFTLIRPEGPGVDGWKTIKNAFIATMAQIAGTGDLNDTGDTVTWKYKGKTPGDKIPGLGLIPPMFIYTPGETVEDEVADDGSAETPAPPKKKDFEGNGPLSEEDLRGKNVSGSGPKFAPTKPDKFSAKPKSESAKADPAKTAATPGYWYDPNDNEAKGSDPIIYVRIDGVATRVPLSEAGSYGVPKGASLDTMTWYSERDGHIVKGKDRGTQKGYGN